MGARDGHTLRDRTRGGTFLGVVLYSYYMAFYHGYRDLRVFTSVMLKQDNYHVHSRGNKKWEIHSLQLRHLRIHG
ncbi:unnamed protein product [Amoebophrya sp. A25]|nr:unnamed protein product [Amoebophrya sp. A25]|eukprot:GSA25T00008870001.1